MTVTQPPPATLPLRVILRRALVADWIRLTSVRSTWYVLAATATMMGLVAFAMATDMVSPTPVWVIGETGILFAHLVLVVPAVLLVTSDYATGSIHPTLMSIPQRTVLGTVRLGLATAITTVTGTLLALACEAVVAAFLGSKAVVEVGELLTSALGVAALLATSTVVVVGAALVLRNTAGTLTFAYLALLVLPVMLTEFSAPWLQAIGRSLPGAATSSMLRVFDEPLLGSHRATVVAGAWMLTAVLGGVVSLTRRDAS